MFTRFIKTKVVTGLGDTPVLVICGPRQSGKSTLAQLLVKEGHLASYVSLDHVRNREFARADPEGFLLEHARQPVAIDEIQRVPELMLELKALVDSDRRPGRFVLTGSANVLQLPRLADSLAGRTELLTLWPLSQAEIERRPRDLLAELFMGQRPTVNAHPQRAEIIQRMLAGGFPEVVLREPTRRAAWFRSYGKSIVEREVHDLSHVRSLKEFPSLLRLLAGRVGGLSNYAQLANGLQLSQDSIRRYVAMLEATYQIVTVRPFARNLTARETRTPKIFLADTGTMAHSARIDSERLLADPVAMGSCLENFVVTELLRQAAYADDTYEFFHYRTRTGTEVDLVIEGPGGKVVAIEIKATATLRTQHFKGLRMLRDKLGSNFVAGVVINLGHTVQGFGERLHALPVTALWCE